MTNSNGFTFIELILVISITAITGILVVPQLGLTLETVHSEVAVNKLMDDIRFTQNYALTNHCNTWFSINMANNSYSYGYYATPPYSDPQLLVDPTTNQQSLVQLDLYPDIHITGETLNNRIDFDWFGHPSSGATITINEGININILDGTGYVVQN